MVYVQQFDFQIVHVSGNMHKMADSKSRKKLARSARWRSGWLMRAGHSGTARAVNSWIHCTSRCSDGVTEVPGFVPYVPNPDQLKAACSDLSESDIRDTYRGSDGLLYRVHTHMVFVPLLQPTFFVIAFYIGFTILGSQPIAG
eukprot:GHVQ01030004.1.p1 GENE.GHVQ01030004.1~~GHVQ01030004.1.p1  ORF type:complete len:143 (+),score=9.72 GHVQ01030004.1:1104-1532(+)